VARREDDRGFRGSHRATPEGNFDFRYINLHSNHGNWQKYQWPARHALKIILAWRTQRHVAHSCSLKSCCLRSRVIRTCPMSLCRRDRLELKPDASCRRRSMGCEDGFAPQGLQAAGQAACSRARCVAASCCTGPVTFRSRLAPPSANRISLRSGIRPVASR